MDYALAEFVKPEIKMIHYLISFNIIWTAHQ